MIRTSNLRAAVGLSLLVAWPPIADAVTDSCVELLQQQSHTPIQVFLEGTKVELVGNPCFGPQPELGDISVPTPSWDTDKLMPWLNGGVWESYISRIYPVIRIELTVAKPHEDANAALVAVAERVKKLATDLRYPVDIVLAKAESSSLDLVTLHLSIATLRQADIRGFELSPFTWPTTKTCWDPDPEPGAIASCLETSGDTQHHAFRKLLGFVAEDLAPLGDVTLEFEGWRFGTSDDYWSLPEFTIAEKLPVETYRVEVYAPHGDIDSHHSSTAGDDARSTTNTADLKPSTPVGTVLSDTMVSTNRGAISDAIGFVHLSAALRRLTCVAPTLTMTRIVPEEKVEKYGTKELALATHLWVNWTQVDEPSSFNVRATGRLRLESGETTQSITDRIDRVIQAFDVRDLTAPEIRSASIASDGTWTVELSTSDHPVSHDLEIMSSLLSELPSLGVHINGNQQTGSFTLKFEFQPRVAETTAPGRQS